MKNKDIGEIIDCLGIVKYFCSKCMKLSQYDYGDDNTISDVITDRKRNKKFVNERKMKNAE
jgi:hypothetical protein